MMNVPCLTPRGCFRKDGTFCDVQIWKIATSLKAGKQPFVIDVASVDEEEFRMCLF